MQNLRLGDRRRTLLIATAVLVALSRFAAVSATMWDWDEALFGSAVVEYDVTNHHPHPPGFPIYVAAAKVFSSVLPPFRAYQAVNLLAAAVLFPLLYALAREAGFPFLTSYLGALLFVFLPNVWFYGGTAFSDIAGTAATFAAVWLLLRGRHDDRAFVVGAILLGVAAGVRSQALLIGCVPALLATVAQWRRSRLRVIGAIAAGIAVIAASYAGAALASHSVGAYLDTSAAVREYLRKVDSFLNPDRPRFLDLARLYFLPLTGGRVATGMGIVAVAGLLAGIARRDRAVLILGGTFLPFALFAWLMLDFNSISRYSVSYVALYAILFADTSRLFTRERHAPWARAIAVAAVVLVTLRMVTWTVPALTMARATPSPTFEAMTWLKSNLGPRLLYVHGSVIPFADNMLRGSRATAAKGDGLVDIAVEPRALYVAEGGSIAMHEKRFVRVREPLWQVARHRYFEVSVKPASEAMTFGAGWYGMEGEGSEWWQWMGARSVTSLPQLPMRGILSIRATPVDDATSTTIAVSVDGVVLERFACSGTCERSWIVAPSRTGTRELVITTDHVTNFAALGIAPDTRDLGLKIDTLGWVVAERE